MRRVPVSRISSVRLDPTLARIAVRANVPSSKVNVAVGSSTTSSSVHDPLHTHPVGHQICPAQVPRTFGSSSHLPRQPGEEGRLVLQQPLAHLHVPVQLLLHVRYRWLQLPRLLLDLCG